MRNYAALSVFLVHQLGCQAIITSGKIQSPQNDPNQQRIQVQVW